MPLAWMGVPPPQGPVSSWHAGMEGILHCQLLSGAGGDRSFRGCGHFYGPNYYMTPGPRRSWKRWLQLLASCGTSWHSQERRLATPWGSTHASGVFGSLYP